MAKKIDWLTLSHEDRVSILAQTSIDHIIRDYGYRGMNNESFRKLLGRDRELWEAKNIQEFRTAGDAPTKDVILGAWRDLDRSEALLELIDNSIDAWLLRKKKYPAKASPELNIYIDIDEQSQQLTYEDNAGGVSIDRLENLVVPGFSETEPLSVTIGSYKTGGKKAIFRLAQAARITTRYWNPSETSDDAVSVQLDEAWINNSTQYKFPYALLKDRSTIEKGQTRYVLQLREEPVGGTPWFKGPENIKKLSADIRTAYTLLLIRNPTIHIYLESRDAPLNPLEDFYVFSGTHSQEVDIRPQQVTFEVEMEFEGKVYTLEIEVVLGCRTTSGTRQGRSWGIDLYGNDRLFVSYDQNMFAPLLPQGNSKSLIRGYINIRGANVFIPWDTHKRHLNMDREIVNILTKHKLIVDLFTNWRTAYLEISRSEVKKTIGTPLPKVIDKKKNDLNIPNKQRVKLDPKRKRGIHLPRGLFIPKVKAVKKKNDTVTIRMNFTMNEARKLASHYGVQGDLSGTTITELAGEIKSDLLKKASR